MIFAERSQVDAHSLASSAGGFLGGYAVFYVLRVFSRVNWCLLVNSPVQTDLVPLWAPGFL